jgi:non-specific protein-tyrosine kinase
MEILGYIRLFRKWLWLLVIATVVGGGAAYLIRSSQPPVYEAEVLVSVGGYIASPNPNTTEIRTGVELAQTYVVLVETRDVLQGAIDEASLPFSVDRLRRIIDSEVITETSLMRIKATYTDPALAADAANAVAHQLILNSPSNLTEEQQQRVDVAVAEVDRLNEQLSDLRGRLASIDAQLNQLAAEEDFDQFEYDRLAEQRASLVDQITVASSTVAEFSNQIADLDARTNTLSIEETAGVPDSPSGSSVLMVTAFGAIIGLVLAVAVVLTLEYMDDTIHVAADATQILNLPMLGVIARFGSGKHSPQESLVTFKEPNAPASEGYRALRTKLLYTAGGPEKKAFVVTSVSADEGKTVTAANLAAAIASANLRVLLIDADLRRPSLHEVFGLDNEVGLTNLLASEPPPSYADAELRKELDRAVQETHVPGLKVIPSGHLPANPTEVLGSLAMERWFRVFLALDTFDVIIFDTSPALTVADASVIAATTGAPVVLVLHAGKTTRSAAQEARDQFEQLNVKIRGLILNGVDPRLVPTGKGYQIDVDAEPISHRAAESTIWRRADLHDTRQLNGSAGSHRTVEITGDGLVIFVAGYQEPISVLVKDRVTVGRYKDNMTPGAHVDLDRYGAFEAGVSREHIAVYREGMQYFIEDLGSINGTWVNGERIPANQKVAVEKGSEVVLGSLSIRLMFFSEEDENVVEASTPSSN